MIHSVIQRSSGWTLATFLKATALWVVICVLAVGNGVLREALLEPVLGSPLGLAISGVLLAVLVLAVALVGAPWYGEPSAPVLFGIGAYWLVLTVVFESALGLSMLGQSWGEVVSHYSFAGGNLWLLVLAFIALAPWGAARIRRRLRPMLRR